MRPVTISAEIPVELADALDIAALRKNVSQDQAICEALQNWLDLQERTHSHDEIKAWAAHLDRK